MRRKLQQLINVGKAIALGSSKDSEDDDDDDYYESDDDEEKSSSSDQDEDEPEEYVDPTRCWGRFYMTPKFDHADMVRLTCTITNGSTSMGGTYGCEGECDIVQRGPKWYIRFRQFELVNVKKSNVYIYLLTSKARHEMPRLEKDGHIVEVDFTDGGTIKGKDCGEEWEQLLEGDDIQNLRWKGVALAKPKTDRPGTAVPLVFGYGSFKPFKRDWHDREDLSNKILTVQKQFEKVTEIMESGKLKHDEMNESEAKEIAKRAFMNCGFSADDELEKNEFERVLSELNYAFTKAKLDPLFKVGDLDLNGDMDFKEFEFVVMLLCRLRPVPRICLWEWFYMFSERNSGYLDYIEFHMCMTALGYNSVTEKKAFNIFSKMHKYGKFHVTYEEFRDLWADVVRKHGNLKMEWKKITGAKPTKRISAHDLVIRVRKEDEFDSDNFEQAKVGAFMQRREKRIKVAIRDADKRHEILDEARTKRQHIAIRNRLLKYENIREDTHADMMAKRESQLIEKVKQSGKERNDEERRRLAMRLKRKREKEKERREREGLDIIDLQGRNLYHIPEEVYKGVQAQADLSYVTYINVSHNKLLDLPNMVVLWMAEARKLDTSYNKLTSIPGEVGMMGQLRILNLSFNKLTLLPNELSRLELLELLDVSNNELESLPDDIGNCTSLTRLNIANNKIRFIPHSIGNCQRLVSFQGGTNLLSCLPDGFTKLRRLERIDFSQNNITKLPDKFGELNKLDVLEMSANQLATLPESIGGLTRLKVLRVGQNRLVELPNSIKRCQQLLDVNMSHNEMILLPEEFGYISKIQYLNISHNHLKNLPDSLGFLRELVVFNARDNEIETLPVELGSMKGLCELDLAFNRLKGKLSVCVGMLTLIRKLNVSHNQIKSLPPNVGTMYMLTELDASFNKIETLPESIGRLVQLKTLHLGTNCLKKVPFSIGKMQELQTLDMSANKLRLLPRQIATLSNLRHLGLYNNQLEALPVEFGAMIPSLKVFDCRRNPLSAYPAKWSGQAEGRVSGYTNSEVVDMLVMMEQVYPCLMTVWDQQYEKNNGHIRDSEFIEEASKQMGSDWREQYDGFARTFLRICQVQGDYPVYHQLLPEEEAFRAQRIATVKRVAENHVNESRRVRDEYVAKMDTSYQLPSIEKIKTSKTRQDEIANEREQKREMTRQNDMRRWKSQLSSLVEKQNWRSVVIEKEKKEKAKRDMQKLRDRMKEIEDARNLRLLIAAKVVEAKERCEKDAMYIKQKGELEEKLEKVREDIEVLQETMSEKAALFATKSVREKAHAREMMLMGREKSTQNEYNSCLWSMKENEEWFAENIKYTEIEKSYEKYQYQRVIAGLSGFANAMGDDLDLDEEDDEEDFFF